MLPQEVLTFLIWKNQNYPALSVSELLSKFGCSDMQYSDEFQQAYRGFSRAYASGNHSEALAHFSVMEKMGADEVFMASLQIQLDSLLDSLV